MVTVRTDTGASLIIDDEVAREFAEFGVKRGCEAVSKDLFDRIGRRQAEIKTVHSKMENPTPLTETVVLEGWVSLP